MNIKKGTVAQKQIRVYPQDWESLRKEAFIRRVSVATIISELLKKKK